VQDQFTIAFAGPLVTTAVNWKLPCGLTEGGGGVLNETPMVIGTE
jgi:hypothetical protein